MKAQKNKKILWVQLAGLVLFFVFLAAIAIKCKSEEIYTRSIKNNNAFLCSLVLFLEPQIIKTEYPSTLTPYSVVVNEQHGIYEAMIPYLHLVKKRNSREIAGYFVYLKIQKQYDLIIKTIKKSELTKEDFLPALPFFDKENEKDLEIISLIESME